MSEPTINPYPTSTWAQPRLPLNPSPKPKRGIAKWWLPATVGVAALLIGMGAGAATVKPEIQTVTKTETVTKEVAKTPKECRTALDLGNQALSSAGTTIGILSDALGAVSRLDAATVQGTAGKVDAQTQIIKGLTPKYTAARSACLASE
jgi:hypothetical protein